MYQFRRECHQFVHHVGESLTSVQWILALPIGLNRITSATERPPTDHMSDATRDIVEQLLAPPWSLLLCAVPVVCKKTTQSCHLWCAAAALSPPSVLLIGTCMHCCLELTQFGVRPEQKVKERVRQLQIGCTCQLIANLPTRTQKNLMVT